MAEFSGKTESPDEIVNRVYVETLEVFSVLEIIRNLAAMHRSAMSGECSDSDRNNLILGAYRTLFLAAGLGRYRMARELQIRYWVTAGLPISSG